MRKDIEAYLSRVIEPLKNQEGGCGHLMDVNVVNPSSADACAECLKIGSSWVNLRLCLDCGNVACCDSSTNKHARKHYHDSGHSIILSYEPRELWMYCFEDDRIYIAPE